MADAVTTPVASPLVRVRNLRLEASTRRGTAYILRGVSLDIGRGRILGVVGLEGLEGANPLDPVARHLLPPLLLSPEEDALTALERMAERGYARALVVEGDRLLGVLSKTDLLRAFQVRLLGLSHLDRPKGPE